MDKLLSKRWWIPTGARLEGPKLEPEGLRAEVGFPTADQGFSSIQGTRFGSYGIYIVFDTWILSGRVVDPDKKEPDLNCEVQGVAEEKQGD